MNDKYYLPPTYTSVQDSHEQAAARLAEIKGRNGRIKIEDLAIFGASMTDHLSGDDREMTAELIGRSLVNVTLLLKKHPKSKELIMGAATGLIFAGVRAVEDLLLKAGEAELKKVRPLLDANRKKAITVERAQTLAADMWEADTAQEYRITEMAVEVSGMLKREGHADLPSIERVKEWIRPVAPPHARLGGRRSKTS